MSITIASIEKHRVVICVLGAALLTGCGGSGTTAAGAPSMVTTGNQGAQTATTAGTEATVATTTQIPVVTQALVTTVTVVSTSFPVVTPRTTEVATAIAAMAMATQAAETSMATPETALAPEVNPAGDIPDSQAFVKYQSPAGGYVLDTPEGWARTVQGGDVGFVDKFNGVSVVVTPVTAAPTAATAQANEVAAIKQHGRAVEITSVKDVQLPGGTAVLVAYTSNSDPNPVTNKQVRLENNSFLFFKNGKLATLRLYAVAGADNVDQWKRMSESFRWQ